MIRKTLFALSICFTLSACETLTGSTGDKFSTAALKENIKPGVSTPQDIRALYGTPDYTADGPKGPEFWSYDIDEDTNSVIDTAVSFIPVFGANKAADQVKNSRSLSVYFDNNRVNSYSISNSRPR